MSHKLKVYLAVALGWAALAGGFLSISGIELDSIAGAALIAVLYMPSPMIAALIAERGLRRARFGLPRRGVRPVLPYFLLPAGTVVGFGVLYLGAVFLGGDLLGIDAFGRLALTQDQMMAGAAKLLGQEAVATAGPPPPAAVLLMAGLCGALIAGWTINGIVAMGEEYGWRGLMWDELRSYGPVRANMLTGVAWGLWHAPLIVQGYNYPGFLPGLGVLAMVAFCIGMSFVLTAVRELTGSLIPVAATHGMLNGTAPILLILADAHPILAGPLGLLGAAIFALLGAAAWTATRHRTAQDRGHCHGAVGSAAEPAAATIAAPAINHSHKPVR